jgi:hypothetical protein
MPVPAVPGVDTSWQFLLGQAHLQSARFGIDFVFSYGPLGFLETHVQIPELISLQFVWQLLSRIAVGILLLQFVRSWCAWLGVVALLGIYGLQGADARLFTSPAGLMDMLSSGIPASCDPFHLTALVVAGAVALRRESSIPLLALALSILGSFVWIKFTLFTASLGILAFTLLVHLRYRDYHRAALAFCYPAAVAVGFWCVAGQKLSDVAPYITGSLEFSAGYIDAMATQIPLKRLLRFALAPIAAFSAVVIYWRHSRRTLTDTGIVIFLAGASYVLWRHATVRPDHWHLSGLIVLLATALLVLPALLPPAEPPTKNRQRLRWIAFIVTVVVLIHTFPKPYLKHSAHLARAMGAHSWVNLQWLAGRDSLRTALAFETPETRAVFALPQISQAAKNMSVDTHGFHQAYAFFNAFTATPRPIPQSYAAYTPQLAQLNAQHVARLPETTLTLVNLQTIDGRYPTLDDAAALTAILQGSTVLAHDANHVLLKRLPRPTFPEPVPVALQLNFDSWTNLPPSDTLQELTVDISFSSAGSWCRHVIPPPPLFIEIETNDGKTYSHRLPPLMAKTPFTLSPYLPDTAALREFIQSRSGQFVRRVKLSTAARWAYQDGPAAATLRTWPANP